MTPFVVGIVLIIGGIAFAAAPLLRRKPRNGGEEEAPQPERRAPTAGASVGTAGAALQLAESSPAVPGAVAVALEELELDRAMGKLSERDYEELRAALLKEGTNATAAAEGMHEDEAADASPGPAQENDRAGHEPPAAFVAETLPSAATPSTRDLDAEAERLVRAARADVVSCPDCGPRPEPGAPFCSNCGRALGGCPNCGARIAQSSARFCDRCGTALTG